MQGPDSNLIPNLAVCRGANNSSTPLLPPPPPTNFAVSQHNLAFLICSSKKLRIYVRICIELKGHRSQILTPGVISFHAGSEKAFEITVYGLQKIVANQCCGSALVSMRIRIQIRIQHFLSMRIRSPPPTPPQIPIQGLDAKNWGKIYSRKFVIYFFLSKIAIYLSLGLHKGRPW